MLDDPADVVERGLAEVGVEIAGEGRPLAFPHRLVGVHAGAVIALDRLRHKGRGLAVLVGHVVHDILVDLHVVGGAHQSVELGAELGLARGDLVVMLLDLEAHVIHD